MRRKLSSAVTAACVALGSIAHLTGCAGPKSEIRETDVTLTSERRFTWDSQAVPEVGAMEVSTAVVSTGKEGELARLFTLSRKDGEEFPTKSRADDERILIPIVREIADAHFCPRSGPGKIVPVQYRLNLIDEYDVNLFLFGNLIADILREVNGNDVLVSVDQTHSGPQKVRTAFITCGNGSAHELLQVAGTLPNGTIVPQTGKGSYETVHKSVPLSGPLQTW